MEIKFCVYVLTDANGNKQYRVVDDPSQTMPPIGGYTEQGKYVQYDSYEAWYLADWATEHGMTVECFDKTCTV